jgi:hypothetical protein
MHAQVRVVHSFRATYTSSIEDVRRQALSVHRSAATAAATASAAAVVAAGGLLGSSRKADDAPLHGSSKGQDRQGQQVQRQLQRQQPPHDNRGSFCGFGPRPFVYDCHDASGSEADAPCCECTELSDLEASLLPATVKRSSTCEVSEQQEQQQQEQQQEQQQQQEQEQQEQEYQQERLAPTAGAAEAELHIPQPSQYGSSSSGSRADHSGSGTQACAVSPFQAVALPPFSLPLVSDECHREEAAEQVRGNEGRLTAASATPGMHNSSSGGGGGADAADITGASWAADSWQQQQQEQQQRQQQQQYPCTQQQQDALLLMQASSAAPSRLDLNILRPPLGFVPLSGGPDDSLQQQEQQQPLLLPLPPQDAATHYEHEQQPQHAVALLPARTQRLPVLQQLAGAAGIMHHVAPRGVGGGCSFVPRCEWELDPRKVYVGRRLAVGGFAEVFIGSYEVLPARTAQHSTAQHSTAQHSTAQHSTAQHSTAQHSTAQHSMPLCAPMPPCLHASMPLCLQPPSTAVCQRAYACVIRHESPHALCAACAQGTVVAVKRLLTSDASTIERFVSEACFPVQALISCSACVMPSWNVCVCVLMRAHTT